MSNQAIATYLKNMHFDIPTCSGQYGEDMASLFVNCYSTEGVLFRRDEYFFSNLIQK